MKKDIDALQYALDSGKYKDKRDWYQMINDHTADRDETEVVMH